MNGQRELYGSPLPRITEKQNSGTPPTQPIKTPPLFYTLYLILCFPDILNLMRIIKVGGFYRRSDPRT